MMPPNALSYNPVSDPINEDNLAEYDAHNEPDMSIAEICTITLNEHHNLRILNFCTWPRISAVLLDHC